MFFPSRTHTVWSALDALSNSLKVESFLFGWLFADQVAFKIVRLALAGDILTELLPAVAADH